jgi:hypothetical protein
MPATAKDCQISVRIPRDTDAWLERRAGSTKNKAGFVRHLIERERDLLAIFNEAAEHVTKEDLEERAALIGSFVGTSGD